MIMFVTVVFNIFIFSNKNYFQMKIRSEIFEITLKPDHIRNA